MMMILKFVLLMSFLSHQTRSQSIFFTDTTIPSVFETTSAATTQQEVTTTTTRSPVAQQQDVTTSTTTTTAPTKGLRCAQANNQIPSYCLYSSVSGILEVTGSFDEVLPRAFEGLDIKLLKLSGLSLKKLNSDSFYGLQDLNVLYLDNNLLENIPNGTFSNLNSLNVLNLQNNLLTKITSGMLQGLKYLNHFILSNNQITTIEEGAFLNSLTNLKTLDLQNNAISKMDKLNLAGLNTLLDLNLAQNNLVNIDYDIFENMTNLENVNISHNNVAFLTNNLFSGQQRISILDASHNQIGIIGDSVFKGKNQMTQIFLNDNKISQLNDNLFNGMDNMQILNLQNNRLNKITSNTLVGLRELKYLFLANNSIEYLPAGWLDALGNLNTIDLSHNLIYTVDSRPFETPTRLQHLNISYNNLTKIESGWFETNVELLELNLRSNNLSTFEPNAFGNTPKLSSLDLGGNSLKKQSLIGVFSKFGQLEILYLDGNPLTTFDADEARCPVTLKQLYLNVTCLEQVRILAFVSLQRIDLQQNYLQSLGSNDLQNLTALKYLDLSNNNVTNFDANILTFSTQFQSLNLTLNLINAITFPTTLVTSQITVDLSWNKISDLSTFPAFKSFYIAGNPLSCSCNNLPFWNDLSSFADQQKTICQTSAKQSQFLACYVSDTNVCPLNTKPKTLDCSVNPMSISLDRPTVYKKSCKFPRPMITEFMANITDSGFEMSWNASNLDSMSWFIIKWGLEYNATSNATASSNSSSVITKQYSTIWPKSQSFRYSNNLERSGVSNICIETVPVYNTIQKDVKCSTLYFPGPVQQTSKLFPMLTYILIAIGVILLILLVLIIVAVCLRKRKNKRMEKEYLESERKKQELQRKMSAKSVIDPNLPQGIPEQSTVSIDMY